MKKLFIETEDFNAMIITDGKLAVDVSEFPQYGTLEDAASWDCSGVVGCESIEDVAREIGTDNIFNFNKSEFSSVTEVGAL